MLALHSFALALTLATPSAPGEIFGDLREADKYIAGAKLELRCGAETAAVQTDSTGSYRVRVKSGGRCSLTVTHEGQTASLEIVVFDQPARYRLVLELREGKYVLKRV